MVARLFACGLLDNPVFPIWTFRDAFEEKEAELGPLQDTLVLAAAQWAEHSAQALYAMMANVAVDWYKAHAFVSFCFKADKVRSLDRWNFWKFAFNDIAGMEVVDEDVQQAALRAATAMWTEEMKH